MAALRQQVISVGGSALLAAALLAAACSDPIASSEGATADAAGDGAPRGPLDVPPAETSDASARPRPPGLDCLAGDTDGGAPFPAPHRPVPLSGSFGGPVLKMPRFVPIVFAGDPLLTDIGAVHHALATSSYWSTIAAGYAIGPATADDPIVVADVPAATMSEGDVATWLAGKLDGTHPEFGNPDFNAIYTVYFPATTALTLAAAVGASCQPGGFGGYHAEVSIAGKHYPFAAIARCKPTADAMSAITAHELFEAASDPLIYSSPAFSTIDGFLPGRSLAGEIADLCQTLAPISAAASGIGYAVPRVWSNTAALAGADPCAPDDGEPYFQTVADLPDATLHLGAQEAKVIELVFVSNQPMPGPWDITIKANDPAIDIDVCRSRGDNGDRVQVLVGRGAAAGGTAWLQIDSTLGSRGSSSFVRILP